MKQLIKFLICLLFSTQVGAQHQPLHEVTLCWDVSLSMESRGLVQEIAFLNQYFSQYPNASVTLLPFSNAIWGREQFTVQDSDWSELEKYLQNSFYDGATSYSVLPDFSVGDHVLLFTDGKRNMDDDSPVFQAKVFIINSNVQFDPANLNLLTILNQAELIQLSPRSKPEETDSLDYFGRLHGNFTESDNILLRIQGSPSGEVIPDRGGNYRISARPGNVLEIYIDGRKAAERELGEYENINIWIEESGAIRLDEVVLLDRRDIREQGTEQTQRDKDKDALGYAVQTIGEEQISEASTSAANATQGKFSGVRLGQNDDLSQVQLRPQTSILSNNYGLVVIDGVPIAQSNSSSFASGSAIQSTGFIDPKNIASITVLKSLAATNRFGSLGANGAILITTKTATVAKTSEKKDLALLTDNIYDGKIRASNTTLTTGYLRELKEAKTISEAYEIYKKQRDGHLGDPAYFMDVFEFFRQGSGELAFRILTNILERDEAKHMELKGLLFKARELGFAPLELQLAQRLHNEYPGNIQSYLDLALAHKQSGNHQIALNLLLEMSNGMANRDLNFTPFSKSIDRELRNLVYQHRASLDLAKLPSQYLGNIRYNARIILDWNKSEAQFELQFVNPQKRFFTWEHTQAVNSKRIRQEIELGYSNEEFEVYGDGVAGDWLINIKFLGNGSSQDNSPVFLKCRVESNFGYPNQRTNEYVLRLHEKGSTVQIAKIKID